VQGLAARTAAALPDACRLRRGQQSRLRCRRPALGTGQPPDTAPAQPPPAGSANEPCYWHPQCLHRDATATHRQGTQTRRPPAQRRLQPPPPPRPPPAPRGPPGSRQRRCAGTPTCARPAAGARRLYWAGPPARGLAARRCAGTGARHWRQAAGARQLAPSSWRPALAISSWRPAPAPSSRRPALAISTGAWHWRPAAGAQQQVRDLWRQRQGVIRSQQWPSAAPCPPPTAHPPVLRYVPVRQHAVKALYTDLALALGPCRLPRAWGPGGAGSGVRDWTGGAAAGHALPGARALASGPRCCEPVQ
jgi:hypothetical protein